MDMKKFLVAILVIVAVSSAALGLVCQDEQIESAADLNADVF